MLRRRCARERRRLLGLNATSRRHWATTAATAATATATTATAADAAATATAADFPTAVDGSGASSACRRRLAHLDQLCARLCARLCAWFARQADAQLRAARLKDTPQLQTEIALELAAEERRERLGEVSVLQRYVVE